MADRAMRLTDVVILEGAAIRAAAYAVNFTREQRARDGQSSQQLDELARLLSACPQGDTPTDAVSESEIAQREWVPSSEAATELGVTQRTIRRIAPQLGGRLHAGRWLLPREALNEHLAGKGTS